MGDINIEMKILDQNFAKIGHWKFPGSKAMKFLKIISKKYGLKFVIREKKEDRDLDWAR